jgi:hypothetical protein
MSVSVLVGEKDGVASLGSKTSNELGAGVGRSRRQINRAYSGHASRSRCSVSSATQAPFRGSPSASIAFTNADSESARIASRTRWSTS